MGQQLFEPLGGGLVPLQTRDRRFDRARGSPEATPIKSSEIARSPVNKIIQGDWPWQGTRDINDKKSVWHNYKGKRTFNMLFGDGHVENYLFPKEYVNWQLSPPYDPKFKWW